MKKLGIILILILLCSFCFSPFSYAEEQEDRAYQIMKEFVTSYPHRLSGTEEETKAGEWIKAFFDSLGYSTEAQNFSYEKSSSITATVSVNDTNIIAKKDNASRYTVVVGAHYDNVFDSGDGQGAYDNGSGVGVMLALSEKFIDIPLDFNLTFIAFGGEEWGLYGSKYYLQNLSPVEKDEIVLYVNIDSISAGDNLYVYCDEIKTFHEDYFLDLSKNSGLNISPLPSFKGVAGVSEEGARLPYIHPALSTDQAAFLNHGIMSVGFSSYSAKRDSLEQVNESVTAPNVMHTPLDRIDVIESLYGEGAKNKMSQVYTLLCSSFCADNFIEEMIYARENNPDYTNIANGKTATLISLGIILVLIIVVNVFVKILRKKAVLTLKEEQKTHEPPKVFGDF